MVAIYDIPLDQFESGLVSGAVAFFMSAPSERNRVYRFQVEGWEVELRKGSEHVVARTNVPLSGTSLIDAAIDSAHHALDLMSVEDGQHLVTKAPADDYIVFDLTSGQRIVRFQGVSDCTIGVDMKMSIIRADGTVEPEPIHSSLPWKPAFRFYRLSQGSRDLFDAYRNMFLGLEALLDQLFPKRKKTRTTKGEQEIDWLRRAVTSAGAKVDLAKLAAPSAVNPAHNIVDRIYAIRVRLFHAKTNQLLIPDERVSYTAVAEVYPMLLALWTEIAQEWLSLKRGSAMVTYEGFRTMIESSYTSVMIGVTADFTPPHMADVTLSPRGLPVMVFAEPAQVAEIRPGRMGLYGRTDVSAMPAGQTVGRVFSLGPNEVPITVGSIMGGLTLDGADVFEIVNILRLVNRNQPRTEFL